MTTEFKNGYDSIMNGANTTNCHFSNFATPEKLKQWEAGRAAAEKEKQKSGTSDKPKT